MTGEQIKSSRRAAGMSRSELAKRVGVSPRTVEGWEQGRHQVGNAAAVGLRRVLKLKSETAQATTPAQTNTDHGNKH